MNRVDEYFQALRHSDRFGHQVAAYRFVEGHAGALAPIPDTLCPAVQAMLKNLGVAQLYSHQVAALASILAGTHTVVATPTASGKTLIYNVPVFEAVAREPEARALYIFPLKALAQDQCGTFARWSRMSAPLTPSAAIYDGDTNAYQRQKIRKKPPTVLMTNPEMVHLSISAHHEQWHDFLQRLALVVIDEVHTYRGMLGAHMAQVIRRLRRICAHHGAHPTFVCASATVADPGQISSQLTGLSVATIQKSGAPRGERHIVLIDPEQSAAQTAILMLKAALARELRTIVYTQSRKMAELIAVWVREQSGAWADRISVYRAGLLPEARRAIEGRLKSGELLAVVSTSALELGIDIGDLDLCILVGYPGSMTATWQRSGRVGRQGQAAGLIMIAGDDALDHYFIGHPAAFFEGEAEKAVVNPFNRVALAAHLECAAAELPLAAGDPWLAHPEVAAAVERLVMQGTLRRSAGGDTVHAFKSRPHHTVNLRGSGERYRIMAQASQTTLGEIDGHRLHRETHPGAIYLHQGVTYRVDSVAVEHHAVYVRPVHVDYYTRVRSHSDVSVLQVCQRQEMGAVSVCLGWINVTDQVTGYEEVRSANGRTINQIPLDVPPTVFETEGIWLVIPADLLGAVFSDGMDPLGALHAAEHAVIAIMPLLVMADRNDLGGLSTSWHPQIGTAAIFIYDGVPGGAGFSHEAFGQAAALLRHSHQVIARCPCDSGCPACVHSPKCGSGNHPIDKAGALALMRAMEPPASLNIPPPVVDREAAAGPATPGIRTGNRGAPIRYGVFDLETQRSALEVGGWHLAQHMKMSCGVLYDSLKEDYFVYLEKDVDALIDHLARLDRVVGFNIQRFDYKVLSGYRPYDFSRLPTLDLLTLVHDQLGFRLSLDHLAAATLGEGKSGSGLDALRWWEEGRLDKIITYCREDVRITRDLYRFACRNGYLIYTARKDANETKFRVPINLQPDINH